MRTTLRALALAAAAVLLPSAGCEEDVGSGDQYGVVTSRESVRPGGAEVLSLSENPSLSGDGRYVAFESDAPDLVDSDTNGKRDIFVKDRVTGAVEAVSVADWNPAVLSEDDCANASISADGRTVAFESAGDLGNYIEDFKVIWVRDRLLGRTRRVLGDPGTFIDPGTLLEVDATRPTISADGRYVAFMAKGEYWTVGGAPIFSNPGNFMQVYVADLSTDPATVMLASASNAPPVAGVFTRGCNNDCGNPRITANGPAVAFDSKATDLDAFADDPVAEVSDIFLATPQLAPGAPAIVVASIGIDGLKASADCFVPAPSADGRYIAFRPGGANFGGAAIARRDLLTPITEPVFVPLPSGIFIKGAPPPPHDISDDGRFVAFRDFAESVTGFGNINLQVWLRDMQGGTTLVSQSTIGAMGNGFSEDPAISGDGRWVAWESTASNLVTGDLRGIKDIFVRGPLR